MYGDLLLDQLGVNFLGPAPLDLELLHMLTTFHWNALGSTLGWWFCHNNTVSCTEKFWVEQVTVPHTPSPGEGQGGGGTWIAYQDSGRSERFWVGGKGSFEQLSTTGVRGWGGVSQTSPPPPPPPPLLKRLGRIFSGLFGQPNHLSGAFGTSRFTPKCSIGNKIQHHWGGGRRATHPPPLDPPLLRGGNHKHWALMQRQKAPAGIGPTRFHWRARKEEYSTKQPADKNRQCITGTSEASAKNRHRPSAVGSWVQPPAVGNPPPAVLKPSSRYCKASPVP